MKAEHMGGKKGGKSGGLGKKASGFGSKMGHMKKSSKMAKGMEGPSASKGDY